MIIDLNELNYKKEIDLNMIINYDENVDKRIKNLKDASLVGKIFTNDFGVNLDLLFTGNMVLADSVTLDDVEYPFTIKLEGS